MPVTRNPTLAVIGMSEDEAAHLRLLMRSVARELEHDWGWGDENGADLLIVDADSFAGQMARTRARGAGVRCVVFSDRPVEDADLLLRRPLQRANVVETLNRAGARPQPLATIAAHTTDFYTRDIGEAAHDTVGAEALPSPGLDAVLRPEPVELRGRGEASGHLAAAATMYAGGGDAASPAALPKPPARPAGSLADAAPHDLREYLADGLLRGPARIILGKAPPLVLDPKNKVAHASSGLRALEPYCRARWSLRDWQPLTSAELAELRTSEQSHSYARLTWLHVLLHSGGRLASHLDPGGSYRLKHWTEIDKDFSKHFRIASAMLQPLRLHEIASASGAPMADVFDFINACDAVGLIEWTPRPRRNDDAKPAPSLLGRLRNPFGRK